MLSAYCFCIIDCSCISCIAPCRLRLMFMHMLDHSQAELESELQEERVPEVFEGPQAISCEDTNFFLSKASLGASHKLFLTFLITIFMLCLIVH
jgi:hypothetical protein